MNKLITIGTNPPTSIVVKPDELVFDGFQYVGLEELTAIGLRVEVAFDMLNPQISGSVISTRIHTVLRIEDTEDLPDEDRLTQPRPNDYYACLRNFQGLLKVRIK